jgi:predicted phosphoadenosine phosphosulfate sulfurtransferase
MNVYQASNKKLDIIFNEFDNIYVSFSGGKDSGILLNLCIEYIRKNKLNIKLGVFHLNYEADYSFTTEYLKRTFEKNKDILVVFNCCIPCKVETCTSMFQSYWRPWEDDKKELWINKIPEDAYTKKAFPFYNTKMWDYEFQNKFSLWHHQNHNAKRTCVLVGIRTQESLNRWRTIHSKKNIHKKYKGIKWIRENFNDVYNAYPIFDWKTEDVWIANYKFNWDYNKLYDMYHKAGVPIEIQRIASPFLGAAKASLKLFKVIEPDTWSKLVSRVNGVNFTGIYGRTTAMGWRSITKPEHFTWENYMYFLLDTLPEKAK